MSNESQIKRQILARSQCAVLQFAREWQALCESEIQEVLSTPLSSQKLTPKLTLTPEGYLVENISYRQLLELPLRLRCVRDVLWVLKQNRVGSMLEVKNSCRKIPWHLILPAHSSITLRVALSKSRLRHEGALEECIAKEMSTLGFRVTQRPNSNRDAYFLLDIKLRENQLQISLSLAGAPLYKRGYKKHLGGQATMREDLAACLTQMALQNYPAFSSPELRNISSRLPVNIYVPFAGSGTLGFEAELCFLNLAPALFGREYACYHFLCTPESSLQYFLKCLRAEFREFLPLTFQEKEAQQADLLSLNTRFFQQALAKNETSTALNVQRGDFFHGCELSKNEGLIFLPINPPWGIRQGEKSQSTSLYRRIGLQTKTLQSDHPDIFGFLVAPDQKAADAFVRACSGVQAKSIATKSGGQRIVVVYFSFISERREAKIHS